MNCYQVTRMKSSQIIDLSLNIIHGVHMIYRLFALHVYDELNADVFMKSQ